MTVKEWIKDHFQDNNGYITVYNRYDKKYLSPQDAANFEVLKVSTSKGYGYKQVNTTLEIYKN